MYVRPVAVLGSTLVSIGFKGMLRMSEKVGYSFNNALTMGLTITIVCLQAFVKSYKTRTVPIHCVLQFHYSYWNMNNGWKLVTQTLGYSS